jgi:hypothetical protein
MSAFYDELDRKESEGRIDRVFANRPENLHDYQGCVSQTREALEHAEAILSRSAMLSTNCNGVGPSTTTSVALAKVRAALVLMGAE